MTQGSVGIKKKLLHTSWTVGLLMEAAVLALEIIRNKNHISCPAEYYLRVNI